MNSKYTYESLMAMTFTDLRAVAAQEGVPSPTNKTKDILARWIIDIQEGLKQPVQSSGRGRPPKQRIVFNPPNSFVTPTGLAGEGVSQLLPEISIPETDGTVEDGREEQTVPEERVSGILEIMQDGYGFLRTNNFLFGDEGYIRTHAADKKIFHEGGRQGRVHRKDLRPQPQSLSHIRTFDKRRSVRQAVPETA